MIDQEYLEHELARMIADLVLMSVKREGIKVNRTEAAKLVKEKWDRLWNNALAENKNKPRYWKELNVAANIVVAEST